ncbi:interleukin-1 receptor-associated kinase 4-like isoform X2 [Pristis pectinata]|uniref:interleukin-1 receptor-associated kinase 4-like isoform X2 n=1 Tax=Pristis pectinata TaxID=685728 RepID=UPI00223D5046|nr:interleukin-1 receptor-associated kinase 4-like isoform X2 [Pristis pectinata]
MNKSLNPKAYIRSLNHRLIRELSDILDPQDGWKRLAVNIKKPTGEPRYSQLHIRRFEGVVQMGKSPTTELLFDWGTTNTTVHELVEILVQNHFLAAASLLLPEEVPKAIPSCSSTERTDTSKSNTACKSMIPVYDHEPTYHGTNCSTQVAANSSIQQSLASDSVETNLQSFSYYELMQRTNNFDERPVSHGGSKIGEGGFGVVYRGLINNRVVAVKKLAGPSHHHNVSPEELKRQFLQEVKTLARCQHENLVELLGFSNDWEHPCLVYAYMSNGSLLDRLACQGKTPPISWHIRCTIALGTADGLKYLHENNHIHRDVKSANILLDALFVPKISDFGLARAASQLTQTMLTDKIVGTTAYMAPEALRGEITPKSDLFSFGVVLLEIITGLKAVDEHREPQLLLDIKEEIDEEEKTIEDYVDKKMHDWNSVAIKKMYSTARQCLNEKKNKRPDITEVYNSLKETSSVTS